MVCPVSATTRIPPSFNTKKIGEEIRQILTIIEKSNFKTMTRQETLTRDKLDQILSTINTSSNQSMTDIQNQHSSTTIRETIRIISTLETIPEEEFNLIEITEARITGNNGRILSTENSKI